MNEISDPRYLPQIIQDFQKSEVSFLSFFQKMKPREKVLFKGWLHSLRVKSHSPLVHENGYDMEIEKIENVG